MSFAAEPLASSTHDEKHFEGARLVQPKLEPEHSVETDYAVTEAPAAIPPPPGDPVDDLPMHQVIRLLRSPVPGHTANSSTRSSAARRVQRTLGNRASQQIVMRARVVQRQCACGGTCAKCQEEQQRQIQRVVQRSSAAPVSAEFDGIPASTGEQLDPATRHPMEAHFGADLADVRVHTGSEAAKSATSLDALAYTSGRDIYFAAGMYAPSSDFGRRLLTHEVAHVVQQSAGKEPTIATKSSHGANIGAPDDPLETEAERAAEQFMAASPTDEDERKKREAGVPVQRFIQRQTAPASPAPAVPNPPSSVPAIVGPPPPSGELVVNTDTNVTFSDNPEYVRFQLRAFVATHGSDRVDTFLTGFYRFGNGLGPFLEPAPQPVTPERSAYFERVINLVRSEAKSLKTKMADFLTDFQRRAVDKLNEMLDASKASVEKERQRYDLKKESSGNSVASGKESEDLTRRARELASKQAALVRAKTELGRAQTYGPHGELPPGGTPPTGQQQDENTAREKYSTAQRDYNVARNAAELRHPVLVSYKLDPFGAATAETLGKLGSTSSSVQADLLAAEIDQKLENIEKVRKDVLDDHSKVWNLDAVIEAAKTYPDIRAYPGLPPGFVNTLVAEKRGHIQANAALITIFSGIALLIVGIVAAIPTGGLSLGAAAAVGVAGVAEAGLMAFAAYQATEKYLFDVAASGTDFDKAKAISQDEPSLFWLALDIIGAAIALPRGLSAFRQLVGLRRLAIAAKAEGQLSEAEGLLNKLQKEGDDLGNTGIGTHLKTETEQVANARVQHVHEFDEIQQNIANKRPSTVAGYTEEIPLKGDHYWRRTSEGTWCRFSPVPTLCFRGGTIEGEALEEHLIESELEQTARTTLRENIVRSGAPLPAGKWQAHHIVPWQLSNHPVVVFVREKFGWSMNSVENGVPLLTKAEDAGSLAGKVATHSGSHAVYSSEVADDLDLLQTQWNNLSPNQIYSRFQQILDQNRARMIRDLGGNPVR